MFLINNSFFKWKNLSFGSKYNIMKRTVSILFLLLITSVIGYSQDKITIGKSSGTETKFLEVPEGEIWSVTSMTNFSSLSLTKVGGNVMFSPFTSNKSLIEVSADDCSPFFIQLPIILVPGTSVFVSCMSNSYVTITKTK